MTTYEAGDCHAATSHQPVRGNRLPRIVRTGWVVAAAETGAREPMDDGRNEQLIRPQQAAHRPGGDRSMPSIRCRRHARPANLFKALQYRFCSSSNSQSNMPCRATRTRSHDGGRVSVFRRKSSRSILFARFRSTAPPIRREATTPRRRATASAGPRIRICTRKGPHSQPFLPSPTAWNSRRRRNRCSVLIPIRSSPAAL
jgi:hypothetical protein